MANQTTLKLSLIDAILYRGTPNTITLPASVVVTTVANVTLKVTMTEAKANNRLTPVEQCLPTFAAIEVELEIFSDSADAHLSAFRQALINRQPIPILVADGSEGGGNRFSGVMGVFSEENSQTLEGIVTNKFTLKPWAVGYAGTQPAFSG
jgi:hypothetical protein